MILFPRRKDGLLRLVVPLVLVLFVGRSAAQSTYPVIDENCYVLPDGGLLENLDYAKHLKISFWGLGIVKESEHAEYMRTGTHRAVIDSVFRQKLAALRHRLGDEISCKRLMVPIHGFKTHVHKRYGPNPVFKFQFEIHVYCEDIEYIIQKKKVLSFKYHLDSKGGVVEEEATYIGEDYFERCTDYDLPKADLKHRLRDRLGVLDVSRLTVQHLDSVRYSVFYRESTLKPIRVYRYDVQADTISDHTDEWRKSRLIVLQKSPVIELLGRFLTRENVLGWQVYRFAVDAQLAGPLLADSIITIGNFQSSHSFENGRVNELSFIKVVASETGFQPPPPDSTQTSFLLAANPLSLANGYPSIEKEFREIHGMNDNDSTGFRIINTEICDNIGSEALSFQFAHSSSRTHGTLRTHLWLHTERKRRSLIGPLTLVLRYDTTTFGTRLVSRGKLAVTKEYSFYTIGATPVFSKSMPDAIWIETIDLAPDQISVTIHGPETYSWFDLLPIGKERSNPNTYGPLLKIEVKVDATCSSDARGHFSIDQGRLQSATINYVDYFCEDGTRKHTFKHLEARNDAYLNFNALKWRFDSLAQTTFRLGDTVTVFGEYLNHPELEIHLRAYAAGDDYNFLKILKVPKDHVIEVSCNQLKFIVPYEIPHDRERYPGTFRPVSGMIRPQSSKEGPAYYIIE